MSETVKNSDSLAGFVLLKNMEYDLEAFQVQFNDDWKIELEGAPVMGAYSFSLGDVTIAILLQPMRKQEAVEGCSMNYSWENSREAVEAHEGFVEFAVLDCPDPVRRHVLFTMTAVSLMKQDNVIGLYRYPTVYSPQEFMDQAAVMKDNDLPIGLWVFLGVHRGEADTWSCYTYGMEAFGYEDMEIVNSQAGLLEMYGFMQNMVKQIIGTEHRLKDGEEIAISNMEKVTIRRSPAVAYEGTTLKVNFRTIG